MSPITLICIVVGLVAVLGALWPLLFGGSDTQKTAQQVASRLQSLGGTPADEADSAHLGRRGKPTDSFQNRVLFPLAQALVETLGPLIPLGSQSLIATKLVQAGYPAPHLPKVFLGIQLLLGAGFFGFLFMMTTLSGRAPFMVGLIASSFFGLMGVAFPLLWLIQQAQKRQDSIRKGLPDFLDLLVICIEAGLGLDTALGKLASLESFKTSAHLREELKRFQAEVTLGVSRKEALLGMAKRTGVDELNSLINAIVQAYDMGASIAHTLRIQSDTLRVKRMQKAEEKANKIPVMMVMPIYIFLFPAIFVSIFGPIAMVLIEAGKNIFGTIGSLAG